MEIIRGVATGAPLWVWPLLALLLWMGFQAMKTRIIPIYIVYIYLVIGVLGLTAMLNLPSDIIAWIIYIFGMITGAFWGNLIQKRWIIWKNHKTIKIRGEIFTMITIMISYFANFISGMLAAIRPETLENTILVSCLSVTFGIVSGTFIGRSLRILYSNPSEF